MAGVGPAWRAAAGGATVLPAPAGPAAASSPPAPSCLLTVERLMGSRAPPPQLALLGCGSPWHQGHGCREGLRGL